MSLDKSAFENKTEGINCQKINVFSKLKISNLFSKKISFIFLLFSVVKSYFSVLIKFNSNTIFSSPKTNKIFSFMFFDFDLGKDENWITGFCHYFLFLILMERISNLISCYCKSSFDDNIKSEFSNDLSIIYHNDQYDDNSIKNFCSSITKKFLDFFLDFSDFILEMWLFFSLLKQRNTSIESFKTYLFVSSIIFPFPLYILFCFVYNLFIEKNGFPFKKNKCKYYFEKLWKNFRSIFFSSHFPEIFFASYFLYFKNRNKEAVNVYLFGMTLSSFAKKFFKFVKSGYYAEKTHYFLKKRIQINKFLSGGF